jgi:hypothetical protein
MRESLPPGRDDDYMRSCRSEPRFNLLAPIRVRA